MYNRWVMNKRIVTLYVQSRDAILLKTSLHQGGEVYDVFGTALGQQELNDQAAVRLAKEVVKIDETPFFWSRYIDHIRKPSGIVTIEASCYKIVAPKNIKRTGTAWVKRQLLAQCPQFRELDAYLCDKSFETSHLSEEFWEDQMERWIDAKITKRCPLPKVGN